MLLLIGFVVQGHIPVFQFQYMLFKAIIIIFFSCTVPETNLNQNVLFLSV